VVAEWAIRRRRAETAPDGRPRTCPAARAIAQMMSLRRGHLSRDEAITLAQIEDDVPRLAEAAVLVDDVQEMVRNREPDHLDAWLQKAERSLVSSFVRPPSRQSRDRRADGRTLVERPGRRPDQPSEDAEAPDVRPRQPRPPQGENDRLMTEETAPRLSQSPFSAPVHTRGISVYGVWKNPGLTPFAQPSRPACQNPPSPIATKYPRPAATTAPSPTANAIFQADQGRSP